MPWAGPRGPGGLVHEQVREGGVGAEEGAGEVECEGERGYGGGAEGGEDGSESQRSKSVWESGRTGETEVPLVTRDFFFFFY